MILQGNTPGASGYNAGMSVTAAIRGENLKLTLSYDYIGRKGFQSSVVFLLGPLVFLIEFLKRKVGELLYYILRISRE